MSADRRQLSQWPLGIVVATLWVSWDLAAKAWVEYRLRLAPVDRVALAPGLDLQLVYDQPPWPLAAAAGSAAAVIALLAVLLRVRRTLPAIAVSLGLGGFLGDLIDQLPDARLTHFIALRPLGFLVPCFNFSEVGIGLLAAYGVGQLVARTVRARAASRSSLD